MDFFQIAFVAGGVSLLVLSLCNFLHWNARIVIERYISESLSEEERILYQKAVAKPYAMLGLAICLLGVFCFSQVGVLVAGYIFSMLVYTIWMLSINKKHLGFYNPRRLKK